MKTQVPSINTMGFYHRDGFVPAWKQAMQFAGPSGRIGTMLDLVDARLATTVNGVPWNNYYTTASAEYVGYSKSGAPIIIVAHGVGPMSTLEGIQSAYSYEYKDKQRNRRGGRISDADFRKLEEGHYGDVSVIDLRSYLDLFEYSFGGFRKASTALEDPLLKARLGPKANDYIRYHAAMSRTYHQKHHGRQIIDPYILRVEDPNNCPYATGGWGNHPLSFRRLDEGNGALAHLVSVGQLSNWGHQSEYRVDSMASDFGCHEWWNGVRLIGVRDPALVTDIHPGVSSVRDLILENWQALMQPVTEAVSPSKLYTLMQHDGTMFTQYQKKGDSLDTADPEHHVTTAEKIGELVWFSTSPGNQFSFCYDVREVEPVMPQGANAYELVGSPSLDGCMVQAYKISVDLSKRLIHQDALRNDYDALMQLLSKKKAA